MSSEKAKRQPKNSEELVIEDNDEESGAPEANKEGVNLEPIAFGELPTFRASGSDMAAMVDTGNNYLLGHKRVMKELKEIMTNNGDMDAYTLLRRTKVKNAKEEMEKKKSNK